MRTGPSRSRGFTLMEAILVIMLTGVVAAMVGSFIREPINAYVDTARRTELADAADLTLRRIAREVQRALPNSVRATGGALEFIPVKDGGRYRASLSGTGTGNPLDFAVAADNSFDVLGPTVAVAAGDQLVVYNLGLPGADVYSGETRRALTSTGSALAALTYTVGSSQFPFPSPGNRFQIVGTPVTYLCDTTARSLRRYTGYAIQATQPTSAAAAPLAALTGVNNALLTSLVGTTATSCTFSYGSGPAGPSGLSGRNAVLTMRLTLTSSGESVTLLHQVMVDNTP